MEGPVCIALVVYTLSFSSTLLPLYQSLGPILTVRLPRIRSLPQRILLRRTDGRLSGDPATPEALLALAVRTYAGRLLSGSLIPIQYMYPADRFSQAALHLRLHLSTGRRLPGINSATSCGHATFLARSARILGRHRRVKGIVEAVYGALVATSLYMRLRTLREPRDDAKIHLWREGRAGTHPQCLTLLYLMTDLSCRTLYF